MKKLFIASLLMFTISAISFARYAEVPDLAITAFEKHFTGAKSVQWEEEASNGYRKATFLWNGHRTIAYYSKKGEFLGSARGIFFAQAPITVSQNFSKKFDDATVLDVTEIANEEGTRYLITMERNKKRYRVTMTSYGDITATQKLKK